MQSTSPLDAVRAAIAAARIETMAALKRETLESGGQLLDHPLRRSMAHLSSSR
jgi:hypothetical protein